MKQREARQGVCIVCIPADWFQCQISIAYKVGRGYKTRTCTSGIKIRCAAFTPIPNRKTWWRWPGSNRRHLACKASALPTELHPHGPTGGNRTPIMGLEDPCIIHYTTVRKLEQGTGIEPVSCAWKALILPLN
jgi:hypothetical protein